MMIYDDSNLVRFASSQRTGITNDHDNDKPHRDEDDVDAGWNME